MMAHIITRDKEGHLVYNGMLSSKEKATADEMLQDLKMEIPQIEEDLKELYGQGVEYKYNLGKILGEQLEKYQISIAERRRFWDEIKAFATKETRIRNEGKNSATRSFYEQCYILSQQDFETVIKLTWRQWQDILDRVGNREDKRIFQWIKQSEKKIREDDWREFEKALHLYLKGKDTSVFDTDELFEIYNSLLMMCQKWREQLKQYEYKHPKSAKLKNKGNWAKKYYARCFAMKKEIRHKTVTEDMCLKSFTELMEY